MTRASGARHSSIRFHNRATASSGVCPVGCACFYALILRMAFQGFFIRAKGFLIQPLRLTDQRARSGTPFRLFPSSGRRECSVA